MTVDQDAGVLEDPVGRVQLGRQLAALVRCRHVGDPVEEWDVGALGGDPHRQPVDVSARPVHLQDVGFLGLGQGNWPVLVTELAGADRVKFGALVVIAQVVLGIKDRELAVRLHQERQLCGFRRLSRGLLRAEHLVADPNPGLTVDGVRLVRGAEDLTEVEGRRVRVEVVLVDELLDAGVEHEVGIVGEVDLLDGQLVGDHGVGVIRDPLGNPVMAGPGLEVPGLVVVGEEDPVGLAGPVLGDQVTEPLDPFARGLDVGEDDRDHGLLVQAVLDQGIVTEDQAVGVSTLGGAHCDVILVDPVFLEEPRLVGPFGGGGVAGAVGGQVELQLGLLGDEVGRHLAVLVDNHVLWPGRLGILVPTDHDRPVDAGVLTNQNTGTS